MKNKTKYDMHHFKFIAEGLKNWDEIIKVCELQLELVKELKKFGCKIHEAVDNGYLFYDIPQGKVKEYCKKFDTTEENLDCFNEED